MLVVLLLLAGIFDYGSPIMCYECNSATNSQCEDVPPPSLRRNCSEHDRGLTHTLCRKIIQHVDFGINGKLPQSRVIRTCGWDESKYKGMCYSKAGYGGRQEVCSCTSDYCNGGQQLAGGGMLAATVLIAAAARICL